MSTMGDRLLDLGQSAVFAMALVLTVAVVGDAFQFALEVAGHGAVANGFSGLVVFSLAFVVAFVLVVIGYVRTADFLAGDVR